MKLGFFAGPVVVVVFLTGCGVSEPSENEMFDAMAKSDPTHQIWGPREKMAETTKKVTCEKAGEKTFKCLIGNREGTGMTLPVTFTKADSGWVSRLGNN